MWQQDAHTENTQNRGRAHKRQPERKNPASRSNPEGLRHTLVLGTRWPFTGVSRALRARKTPKKSEKVSPGPPSSLEKVSKESGESGKSLERVWRVWKKSRKGPERLFETFP